MCEVLLLKQGGEMDDKTRYSIIRLNGPKNDDNNLMFTNCKNGKANHLDDYAIIWVTRFQGNHPDDLGLLG